MTKRKKQNLQAKLLGIDPSKAKFLSLDSPFPVENRLIHVIPVIRWDATNPEPALLRLAQAVPKILELHPFDRGIIHVSSYSQAARLIALCRDSRLITHTNAKEKERALERMFNTPGMVFVSPSSHEGLDLVDDLSRFQVIAKLPYASLGDKRIKRRTDANQDWYNLYTAQKLIQAAGRSIRSSSDYAVTYLLDRGFRYTKKKNGGEKEEGFYARAHQFFPAYFLDSLREGEVDV
jgi:Rad3-related DNA helicase